MPREKVLDCDLIGETFDVVKASGIPLEEFRKSIRTGSFYEYLTRTPSSRERGVIREQLPPTVRHRGGLPLGSRGTLEELPSLSELVKSLGLGHNVAENNYDDRPPQHRPRTLEFMKFAAPFYPWQVAPAVDEYMANNGPRNNRAHHRMASLWDVLFVIWTMRPDPIRIAHRHGPQFVVPRGEDRIAVIDFEAKWPSIISETVHDRGQFDPDCFFGVVTEYNPND